VLTAVVTNVGGSVQVELAAGLVRADEEVELPEKDLNPIAPEPKEMAWGFGSFVVFALLMRYVLYPPLKRGMDARYAGIRDAHESAEQTMAAAQADVADYQRRLAEVKAEAAGRLDAARAELDAERQRRLEVVNAEIAERRAAATARAEAARAEVLGQIEAAVASVASRATELAIGRAPSADAVQRAVTDVMSVGAGR